MFVIQHASRLYFHNKGRIILFESEEEANNFMNMFIQYSTDRFLQEGCIGEAMQVPIIAMQECQIVYVDSDIYNVECGTVFARELFEKNK